MTDKQTLSTDKILAHSESAVGHVIFNNPERYNAVSLEMWDAVEQALSAFLNDNQIRVVVLSGAGGKAFVSGADISKFEKERGSKEATGHYNARLKVVYELIENFPKPTIAMINGHCLGGGLNLATCTDFRIASSKSRFAMPAAKLALGYPFDAIRRLMNAVGPAAAKQFMFTAKSIDAEAALQLGLVQEVVDEDTLTARVNELADHIAANAPLTIAAMKFISTQVMHRDPT
nr:enoyl-CoA hydratase/isomerase family protein [Gammaproteobacteria bacterium]